MKTLYLVRHCRAAGQEPDAPLTPEGETQAEALADLLAPLGVERIVSSPFLRARRSVEPLAGRLRLRVETDDRLVERVLSAESLPDWPERLRASFDDLDLRLPGGESSREATARGGGALDDALAHPARTIALVTHGNLLALLLKRFDPTIGFERWRALRNPDVFRAILDETYTSADFVRLG